MTVASYAVLTYIILISGGIYSVHIASLYLLMLTGFWADRRIGHCLILINILTLVLIYYLTAHHTYDVKLYSISSNEYSLLFHACMTLFFGAFFSFIQQSHHEAKAMLRKKQLPEISALSKLVETRNVELDVYYDSDNPMVLFYLLVDFGQNFYNQFDIPFSATPLDKSYFHVLKTAPPAGRNLIFIFKEVMTNAAKHAGATQINLKMNLFNDYVKISLKDNGLWKESDDASEHKYLLDNGLKNIMRRCTNNDFKFNIYHNESGTCVEVYVPVTFSD